MKAKDTNECSRWPQFWAILIKNVGKDNKEWEEQERNDHTHHKEAQHRHDDHYPQHDNGQDMKVGKN